MEMSFSGYEKRDWLVVIWLVALIFLITAPMLTVGLDFWGDDFAAYINEGIAISQGRFEEQTYRNFRMHTSPLPDLTPGDPLVYVWGYPLLLAVVHGLVGFNSLDPVSIFYYKFPSLIAYALLAGVLYLWYRRRFARKPALFITLLFMAGGSIMEEVNLPHSDVLFLFLSVSSLLLSDIFLSALERGNPGRSLLAAMALGVALWAVYETRLNGVAILVVVAIDHVLCWASRRKRPEWRRFWLALLPYALFFALKSLSEWVLAPATSNMSDVGRLTGDVLFFHFKYYIRLTLEYFQQLIGVDRKLQVWPVLCLLLVIGFLGNGRKRERFSLSCLLVGSYVVLMLLPYHQGLRYMYNILPVLLLFVADGGAILWGWLKKYPGIAKTGRYLLPVMAAGFLLLAYTPKIQAGVENVLDGPVVPEEDVYAPEAIELYRYIQTHIPEDADIAFVKPRALYLNTGRNSFCPNVNGSQLEEAEYLLHCYYFVYKAAPEETLRFLEENVEPVFQNRQFVLYPLNRE